MWTNFYFGLLAAVVLVVGALAIVFARRSSRLEAKLKLLQAQENHVFDFLHGVGAAFSEGVASAALHRLIVESAQRILGAQSGILYVADKNGLRFVPGFTSKDCPAFVPVPERVLAAGGAPARRWKVFWNFNRFITAMAVSPGIFAGKPIP